MCQFPLRMSCDREVSQREKQCPLSYSLLGIQVLCPCPVPRRAQQPECCLPRCSRAAWHPSQGAFLLLVWECPYHSGTEPSPEGQSRQSGRRGCAVGVPEQGHPQGTQPWQGELEELSRPLHLPPANSATSSVYSYAATKKPSVFSQIRLF